MAFHPDSQPLIESKRSIAMTDERGTKRPRPAPRTILDQAPEPIFQAVRALDDTHFALAWGGRFITSKFGVEIRALPDARLVKKYPGCAYPLELRAPYLLANGALSGGYPASTRIIDLAAKRVIGELPITHPYAVTRRGTLFAYIRKHYDFQSAPLAPRRLVVRFPALKKLVDADGGVLVHTDREGHVAFAISVEALAPVYPALRGIALARDERTLYYSATRSVGALDIGSRKVIWSKDFSSDVVVYAFALSPEETQLAIGGSGESTLRILDSRDGRELFATRTPRVDALTFHGAVLIAGTSTGELVLVDEQLQERRAKVASAGINDLAAIDGGLLCACRRTQLRFVPLLDDE